MLLELPTRFGAESHPHDDCKKHRKRQVNACVDHVCLERTALLHTFGGGDVGLTGRGRDCFVAVWASWQVRAALHASRRKR